MKKITAYRCDYCNKVSSVAGAMTMHEKNCRMNTNIVKCKNCVNFDKKKNKYDIWECYCKVHGMLKKSYHDNTQFIKEERCQHFIYETKSERSKRLYEKESALWEEEQEYIRTKEKE